ncbi:hypothetical protein Tco_0849844 [Tanacetum coccineum]
MLKNRESRCIHEGHVVFQDFDSLVYVESIFSHIAFDCLLKITEQICPRFILEFYSQYRVYYTLEGQMLIEFVIQNKLFSFTIEEFGQILGIPINGACSFTDKWSLDDLRSERYNRAYFIEKRMELVTKQPRLIMPYGMLLTRLFKHVMTISHGVLDDYYDLHDHVMYPLTAQQERKTRKDYGTKRGQHSTSSSSSFGQPSSSHLNDDDDDDGNNKGTSRASTPSPTHFVNSLTNEVPRVFENPPNVDPDMEPFYPRQTKIINRQVQLRDEYHGRFRSIRKGFKNLWRNMKKK